MLFRWIFVVFTNALVSFKGRTYVQRHGFPMGTPLAPAAANTFMAVKEDWLGLYGLQPLSDCFQSPDTQLALFRRHIDDYTIILLHATDADVQALYNELAQRIKSHLSIELQHNLNDMVTLDLHVRKCSLEQQAHSSRRRMPSLDTVSS